MGRGTQPAVACPDIFKSAIKMLQSQLPREGFLAAFLQTGRRSEAQEWRGEIRLRKQGGATGLGDERMRMQAEQKSSPSKSREGGTGTAEPEITGVGRGRSSGQTEAEGCRHGKVHVTESDTQVSKQRRGGSHRG